MYHAFCFQKIATFVFIFIFSRSPLFTWILMFYKKKLNSAWPCVFVLPGLLVFALVPNWIPLFLHTIVSTNWVICIPHHPRFETDTSLPFSAMVLLSSTRLPSMSYCSCSEGIKYFSLFFAVISESALVFAILNFDAAVPKNSYSPIVWLVFGWNAAASGCFTITKLFTCPLKGVFFFFGCYSMTFLMFSATTV